MKYKKYPKYKSSGIEWLREIPEHWVVKKLKYITKNIIGGGTPTTSNQELWSNEIEGIPWVSIEDMTNNKIVYKTKKYISKKGLKEKNLKIIPKNALLYSIYASLGKVAKTGINLTTNQAILGLIPKKTIETQYLFYALKSMEKYIQFLSSNNTQSNLNAEKVKNLFLVLPLLSEQKAIASFLDKATAKIDNLIQKEEELIKLLEEKKEALITKAVTKGLKNAKLKDSGIEWLGEIPEHWEVRKLSRLFKNIGSGTTPSSNKIEYYENGNINWLQTGDLNDGYINNTSKKITEKALEDYSTLKIYPPNSLVIAMYGATIGKLGILNIYSATNQACCVLSDYKYKISKYIFYTFLAFRKHIISLSYGGGQPNISQETIKSLKIPLPPLSEQKQIAEYLDKKLAKIDKLIEKSKKAIELLKEKKESLITNAVTGKIDVRDFDET